MTERMGTSDWYRDTGWPDEMEQAAREVMIETLNDRPDESERGCGIAAIARPDNLSTIVSDRGCGKCWPCGVIRVAMHSPHRGFIGDLCRRFMAENAYGEPQVYPHQGVADAITLQQVADGSWHMRLTFRDGAGSEGIIQAGDDAEARRVAISMYADAEAEARQAFG